MKQNIFDKILALVLAVMICVVSMPSLAIATEFQTVMKAVASEDKITVTVNNAGNSGTAELYRYEANEYHSSDTMRGLSSDVKGQGKLCAAYTCGTSQELSFDRYSEDGTDGIFSKYYLIQNGKILAGPVYVTDIPSARSIGRFDTTKKGMTWDSATTMEVVKDMGIGNTVVNFNLTECMYANEDTNGNKIDNSQKSDVIAYECNGEVFYFRKSYVEAQDNLISSYSKHGINVSMVIISWAKLWSQDYPSSLLYLPANQQPHTMAFNTSNDRGNDYWVAAMDFLANRYSQSAEQGLVQQFVIGNEIDYTYDWYLMQPEKDTSGRYKKVEFNKFMEEYARTLRMANQAVKKYNEKAKVCISITHNWAENSLTAYGYKANDTSSRRYISYAPKEMLDWLVKNEGVRGDYNWGIAAHPYPIGTSSSIPTVTDLKPSLIGSKAKPVTGDWKTSPWVTTANLEIYQQYLQQPVNKYNGTELRTVYLTETSICSVVEGTKGQIEKSEMEQAGSIAQVYYRAANLECIESIDYFQLVDQEGDINNKLGLMKTDGTKKPAYTMWKYIDTDRTYDYSSRFLKYLDSKATSYKQLMTITKSDFDWNSAWNESNIQVRKVATGQSYVERIYGDERYATALSAADKLKQIKDVDKFDNIVVASGTGFADALAGSYLAKVKNAPIVLVNNDKKATANHNRIADYINSNLKTGGKVYILGGSVAVPDTFEAKINEECIRLGGDTRYETNLLILEEAGASGDGIIVCTGTGFADSLSASASGKPILLVDGTAKTFTNAQKNYFAQNKGNKFYIIGGEVAINKTVANIIKGYGVTERIGGDDRYETSTLFAQKFFDNPDMAVLVYAQNFPDGLSGGPVAMALGAPLILTATKFESRAVAYAKENEVFSGIVLGGPILISNEAVSLIYGNVR